jgi:hypothetical protein
MSNRKIIVGFALVVLGLLLLMRTLGIYLFDFGDFMRVAFPLLLVGLGIWMIRRRSYPTEPGDHDREVKIEVSVGDDPTPHFTGSDNVGPMPPPPPRSEPRTSEQPHDRRPGKLRYHKLIGEMFIDCGGVDLQDVEISNFLGDIEVKLHGGKLASGLNRMVISGFIGDVRVLVPQGMPVFAQSSNFIGDLEIMGRRSSGFGNNLDAQTSDYGEADAKLYIASNHFIGDVRVYVV